MTLSQKIMGLCVFLAAGVTLMLVQESATTSGAQQCKAQCDAEGKDYVYAPAGTVSRSVEGGRNWNDPPDDCRCVSRRVAPSSRESAK